MEPAPKPSPSPLTWDAAPWLVVAWDGRLYCRRFSEYAEQEQAAQWISSGDAPSAVFGRAARTLSLSRVRAVEWAPAVKTVLVRRHWLRDPWRLVVVDEADGERLFRGIASILPGASEPVEARVGPQDLAMDPRLGLGILLAFLGLVALFGGAVEGAGNAPLLGPASKFKIFAELGEMIGVAGVLAIGAVAFAAGSFALVRWYRQRPIKFVVRAGKG